MPIVANMSDPVATKSFGGNALDEKVAPVVEEAPTEFEDSKHRIDDEAGALANRALASGDLDTVESRKVLRKIDLYILPLLFVTYGEFLTLSSPNNLAKVYMSPIYGWVTLLDFQDLSTKQ